MGKVVDFTQPFKEESNDILINQVSDFKTQMLSVFEPFDFNLWLTCAGKKSCGFIFESFG